MSLCSSHNIIIYADLLIVPRGNDDLPTCLQISLFTILSYFLNSSSKPIFSYSWSSSFKRFSGQCLLKINPVSFLLLFIWNKNKNDFSHSPSCFSLFFYSCFSWYIVFFLNYFVYLFLAVLGLGCCTGAGFSLQFLLLL